MKAKFMIAALAATLAFSANVSAGDNKPVGITPDMKDATVKHDGKSVTISRNPDNANTVNPAFAKTSRHSSSVNS